jgi:HAMP domain-containing protein
MFRNLQIRSKLGAILVLPLAALLVFASFQVGASVSNRAAADRLNRLTGLAVRLTEVADKLQQERATSSGFVASDQKSFQQEMADSRARVDREVGALRSNVAQLDLSDYSDRLRTDLNDVLRRVGELEAWRSSLDSDDIPVSRVVNFYGEMLQSLQAVIADIGVERGSENVKADIAALVEISRAKEAVSQSTGVLLTALLKHGFVSGDYQRFATLVGEEDASVARFESTASREQDSFFERTVGGANSSSLAEVMRQAALAGPESPPQLNPTTWLNVMSQKIQGLHNVELRVAGDVAAAATAARNVAVRQTIVTTIAMIVIVALALGLSLLLARSMAQPLYVLERAARDVAEEQLPGVVERLQRSDAALDELTLESLSRDRAVPVRSRDEIGRVAEAFNSVQQVAMRVAAEQAALRKSIGSMFLNLARRSQRLVDRQLELIDELERDEADPEALENLFKLDHLATRMRRNAEDLIVLSGAEPPRRWSEPVPLPQVVRGAVAEVEDYQRVELLPVDDVGVVGHAVADIIHLLAELLENATSFSPPGTTVRVAGQPAATGYVVEIEDRGLGMSDDELMEANERLANPPAVDFAVSRMLGLFVVGRLAQRYSIRVQLRHSWYGGVTALVLVPSTLLTWSAGQESALTSSRPELPPVGPTPAPMSPMDSVVPLTATTSPAQSLPGSGPPAAGSVRPPIPVPPSSAAAAPEASRPMPVDPDFEPAGPPPPLYPPPAPAPAAAGGRPAGDRLPIFEQARSDWFDSGAGASYLPLRRHGPQHSTSDEAAPPAQGQEQVQEQEPREQAREAQEAREAPPVPAPAQPAPQTRPRRQPQPEWPPPPAASYQAPAAPQAQQAPSGLPVRPTAQGAAARQPLGGPAPAQGREAPPSPQPMTSTGLPRRVPRANLAPGITTQTWTEQRPQPQPAGTRMSRSPDDIRAMLSSYRSGLERGRRMAAGSDTFTYQPGGGPGLGRGGPDEPAGFGPVAPRSNDEPPQ